MLHNLIEDADKKNETNKIAALPFVRLDQDKSIWRILM